MTFEEQPADYICEVYSSDVISIIFDREVFGLPRLPGHVSMERLEKGIRGKLAGFSDGRAMLGVSLQFSDRPPARPGGARKKIFLKYIPSPDLGKAADVKKLVEMKYGRPIVQRALSGIGNVELLEGAPWYLREAGIGEVIESLHLDMELQMVGAAVLHDYL